MYKRQLLDGAHRGRVPRASAARRAVFLIVCVLVASRGGVLTAAPLAKVDEICRTLTDDSNYKVRVQAALVLGKLGDAGAVACLTRALGDQNKTVRAMSAQALGQIGDGAAQDSLRSLSRRDPDPFVRSQVEKALALLSGPAGAGKRAKM